MSNRKVRFTTRVDRELLASVKDLARQEGRQIQDVVNEAFSDLLAKRKNKGARPHVMSAYTKSHAPYAAVYKKLAE